VINTSVVLASYNGHIEFWYCFGISKILTKSKPQKRQNTDFALLGKANLSTLPGWHRKTLSR